jgi:sugar phosphate isomerase/epimerase
VNTRPPAALATHGGTPLPARLGFAVMVGEDGNLPHEVLTGLKDAGYSGIEPNCYQAQHLHAIVDMCHTVGIAIHAIPTGRWMNVAAAVEAYDRYTTQAFEVLREGAAIAAALDVPLIFGLIRGPASIDEAQAEAFLASVIPRLTRTRPQLKVLVEPIASDEASYPHTIEQGARLLERLNLPQVKLLADSYHIARSGEDPRIERYRSSIGHLHIRDSAKQIPTNSTPEDAAVYAAIIRLWREEHLVLSFEPDIDLDRTLEQAIAGVQWINHTRASSRQ